MAYITKLAFMNESYPYGRVNTYMGKQDFYNLHLASLIGKLLGNMIHTNLIH